MHATEIQEHARRMLESLGDKAVATAAQKAAEFERSGNEAEAKNWRRIESALIQMRGPHAS
jgi:vacuolar-type H+-ATPase subunit E/Vma4